MTARDSGRTAGHAGRDPHEDGVQLSLSLERRILLTRAAMFWENLCACFWPLALYVGALAALSLLDFWGTLPGLVRSGLFWISFAGFLYLTWRGLMRFQTPSPARDAARRAGETGALRCAGRAARSRGLSRLARPLHAARGALATRRHYPAGALHKPRVHP